jgi:hypothetical protein
MVIVFILNHYSILISFYCDFLFITFIYIYFIIRVNNDCLFILIYSIIIHIFSLIIIIQVYDLLSIIHSIILMLILMNIFIIVAVVMIKLKKMIRIGIVCKMLVRFIRRS